MNRDKFSKKKRSEIMSAIRGSGNRSTEGRLIALMKERGVVGWRRNYPLFGRPDFVFPRRRMAVFVDGCFWHGCACKTLKPVHNAAYWSAKIERNKRRDRLVNRTLKEKGWLVVRIKECRLKKGKLPAALLNAESI